MDSILLNYERDLFDDLNSLGRYNRDYIRHADVTTYLLNIERGNHQTVPQDEASPNIPTEPARVEVALPASDDNNVDSNTQDMSAELTPEVS